MPPRRDGTDLRLGRLLAVLNELRIFPHLHLPFEAAAGVEVERGKLAIGGGAKVDHLEGNRDMDRFDPVALVEDVRGAAHEVHEAWPEGQAEAGRLGAKITHMI